MLISETSTDIMFNIAAIIDTPIANTTTIGANIILVTVSDPTLNGQVSSIFLI